VVWGPFVMTYPDRSASGEAPSALMGGGTGALKKKKTEATSSNLSNFQVQMKKQVIGGHYGKTRKIFKRNREHGGKVSRNGGKMSNAT